jgi:predicted permease
MSQGKGAKYVMILSVVVPTAIANTVITQLAYEPLRRVLRLKDPDAAS